MLYKTRLNFRYEKLKECGSFIKWFSWKWQLFNRFGVQEWGIRFCGLTFSNWRDEYAVTDNQDDYYEPNP